MKRSNPIAMAALLFIFASAAPKIASAQNGKLSTEKRAQIESSVSKFMAAHNVPGLSVAIVENSEFEWSEGFGKADLKKSLPVTSKTLFRLASVSKPLTAAGAMELSDGGKLDLDAPMQKYCPSFPEKPWPITTRELLGHLGGIRHYRSESQSDPEIGNTKHFDNPIAAGIKFFANDPLVAQPGTHIHYSTQGYTLVGCAIEGASSEKYVAYMHEHVFVPTGMTSTQEDDLHTAIPERTSFYHKEKSGKVVDAEPLDSSYKVPGGGWISSADDMARFEVAMLNDRLVKRATRDLMWAPQKPTDGSTDNYGYGWGVGETAGVPHVGHAGGQQGTSTSIMILPSRGDGVVVLINMDDVDATGLASDLMKIVLSETKDNSK
jgi:serine beta-lactamase-like protein LACTB